MKGEGERVNRRKMGGRGTEIDGLWVDGGLR